MLLEAFVEDPCQSTASHLVIVPAIYQVLKLEEHEHKQYSQGLIAICRWVSDRARTVFESMVLHAVPDTEVTMATVMPNDWRKVSTQSFSQALRYLSYVH